MRNAAVVLFHIRKGTNMRINKKTMRLLYIFTVVLWIIFFLLLFDCLGMFFRIVDGETRSSIELWMKICFSASLVSTVFSISVNKLIKEINRYFDDYQQRISELEKEIKKMKKK